MPVAGEGAPLVAEFSVTEFAAAIGMSTDAGKRYVGHALELRHRLPRVWRRVVKVICGRGWPAGSPSRPSCCRWTQQGSWTGTSLPTAHRIGPVQLERLVDEAIATYMPDLAEERRLAKADGRYFTVEQQENSYDGTRAVHGELDLADALDLEQAIAASPPSSRTWARRSPSTSAARWRSVSWPAPSWPSTWTRWVTGGRSEPVETHPHPAAGRALRPPPRAALDGRTARLEQGNQLVTAGQVRDWCGTAGKWW